MDQHQLLLCDLGIGAYAHIHSKAPLLERSDAVFLDTRDMSSKLWSCQSAALYSNPPPGEDRGSGRHFAFTSTRSKSQQVALWPSCDELVCPLIPLPSMISWGSARLSCLGACLLVWVRRAHDFVSDTSRRTAVNPSI